MRKRRYIREVTGRGIVVCLSFFPSTKLVFIGRQVTSSIHIHAIDRLVIMSSYFGFQNKARSKHLLESQSGPVKYVGLNGNTLLYTLVATAT